MPLRPSRVLSASAALVLAAGVCSARADKDPIRDKLVAARATYDAEIKQARKQAEDWLEKREATARKDGNKKLLDQVKEERKAFEEDGELPKAAPAVLRQKPAAARKAMDAAYAEAVKAYTRAKKDDEAAAVEEAWKAFGVTGPGIDLLALADPKEHAVVGEWKRDGKAALVGVAAGKQARLQFPYEPGEEYDLEVKCKRLRGDDNFSAGLVVGGRQVLAVLDVLPQDGYRSGLNMVDQKGVDDNPTTVKGQFLKPDQVHTVTYSVRAGRVDVAVDGKPAYSFKGAATRLSLHETSRVPNEKALFLFIGVHTSFQFDQVVLTPVKGKGKVLK
jgi:hypothetical protein